MSESRLLDIEKLDLSLNFSKVRRSINAQKESDRTETQTNKDKYQPDLGETPTRYACPKCNKTFKSKKNRNAHLKSHVRLNFTISPITGLSTATLAVVPSLSRL
jgi:hypothetical protein